MTGHGFTRIYTDKGPIGMMEYWNSGKKRIRRNPINRLDGDDKMDYNSDKLRKMRRLLDHGAFQHFKHIG